MCGINYDPLQSHDEAASGNETFSPVAKEFTSAVTGANGCETLCKIKTRKFDTLWILLAPTVAILGMKNIRSSYFPYKNRLHTPNVSSQMWRARMRKSKSRSFNPSSPLFLDSWKGKSDRRTSKYFDSIRILIWHVGKHAYSAMLGKHSLRLSVKRTKGSIFNFRHLLFMREVLNGSKATSDAKKAKNVRKLKGFPTKSGVFGSIWN